MLKKGKSSAEGLYVENRGRSKKRNDGKDKGKTKDQGGRSKSRNKNGKKGTCFICGKEGHWKRECPMRGQKQNESSSVNTVAEIKQPLVLTVSSQYTKDEWVMDSGCTFHITPNKELMFDLTEFEGGKVHMANSTYSEVHAGYESESHLVWYVGEVRMYLHRRKYKLRSSKMVRRLGHMSSKNMEVLSKEGYIPRMEIGELGFCESCVLGKSHKQSFPKAKHTTKGILEYVHSDLWGSPSTPESLGGAKYFISFIDDYSKKLWVYFLRTKDEAFSKFKEWKEAVESHTEKKIKCLRTDNGLEFCNTLFDDLCRKSGIKRHRTCTYTPQQNGVSERMNRTIMDKVRKERWSGQKPDLTHLRRFGCTAYVHTIQEVLELKGTFLGYPFGVKGYRVWIPEDGKCTTSRNVVFKEDEVYKDLNSSSRSTSSDQSTATQKKKSGRKNVTFDTQLIQGPTPLGAQNLSDVGSEGSSDIDGHEISSSDADSSQGGATSSGGATTPSSVDPIDVTSDDEEEG
ncbi:unnamed protein product [Microthlaspi erraticum]|uniref:Integrase catalytic domain-containing protein n=1 Tax=Microthlaspi erraticum TaxID=1685480 RepID=A0A6D2IKH9_9BRAS|nr:unnamed protein product [Microthlaspi erraticum]